MIFYIRNKKNQNICGIEVYPSKYDKSNDYYIETKTTWYICEYTQWVVNQEFESNEDELEFYSAIETIDELRGYLWESFFTSKNIYTEKNMDKWTTIVKNTLKMCVEKMGDDIYLIED